VTSAWTAAGQPVRVRIFLPADPGRMRIGGIATFVRGFVKYAPEDFELSLVGVTASLPTWTWHRVELEGRRVGFLPVVHAGDQRGRVPIAARYVAALARRGRGLGGGVVGSFHRPLTDLPIRQSGPMWRVVHLGVEDLATEGSESRWARIAGGLAMSERRSFHRMERIYVVNRQVTAQYRARFPEVAARFTFLPNWVDPAIFRAVAAGARHEERGRVAGERGLAPEAPLLMFAGRLEGQKDPLLLVRALAALRERQPDAHLLVAGEGSLEAAARAELQALGISAAATFLGTVPREEVARLMHAADALLITSAFETGPTVGLEALASGLPVVTTNVGEVAAVVAASGAGRVAAERTPEAVAAAADWVLTRPSPGLRDDAVRAAQPFLANRVLGAVYDANREMAARLAFAEPNRPIG
jgi:glycosyltransferase involved in cell wall biosynthesis